MEIKSLINEENNLVVAQFLAISKQDTAIKNAVNALNGLNHIKRLEFTDYGQNFGLSMELLNRVNDLQNELKKVIHGRY